MRARYEARKRHHGRLKSKPELKKLSLSNKVFGATLSEGISNTVYCLLQQIRPQKLSLVEDRGQTDRVTALSRQYALAITFELDL